MGALASTASFTLTSPPECILSDSHADLVRDPFLSEVIHKILTFFFSANFNSERKTNDFQSANK